ncbi:MAG TPA: DJ-1/PfpI family protein [Gemmatimonadales bacterium]|nr:DJ-1/PfpI family protein [Gemmatimonadales bacterium]
MRVRRFVNLAVAVLALGLGGFAAWLLALPPAPAPVTAPPVPAGEVAAILDALRPPTRERPLVAIVGINDATETTDYLMPLGILRRADVAEVVTLATEPGPVRLYPALAVDPDGTIAEFDSRHPEGADYVIVPAMSRDDDPLALAWIRSQAGKGATIISVCAGAKVVAAAGLLEGRRATTHWYYLDELLEMSPAMTYVADRRIVVDDGVATTTGITASMPMMLTLIEAIAGRGRADSVAQDLGVSERDLRHASGAFRLTRPFALTVLGNVLTFWNREELGLALSPGMDEVSLALVADAWSRTYRSRAVTFADATAPVRTRAGARIIPDRPAGQASAQRLPAIGDRPPAHALDDALGAIEQRYGDGTSRVVAMQLEYGWKGGKMEGWKY